MTRHSGEPRRSLATQKRNLSIETRQRVHEISVGVPSVARVWVEAEDCDERNVSHANSLISASACSSQNRISISRYIADAETSLWGIVLLAAGTLHARASQLMSVGARQVARR